ncbi:hypothetical protein PR048_006225 [Dryococelus australis]|uniref:Uncharacterized protein n=1 Tax=Dryococelus australis TaxID=614101 RepID=A0ABQ9IAC0_9NEOP|nr:hypothetical protein PR048_006225 [Dryococelus australis]
MLKKCIVFLKMNACTCHSINYFAINVQFVCDNNDIVNKTLAVNDTQVHHTASLCREHVPVPEDQSEIGTEQDDDNLRDIVKSATSISQILQIPCVVHALKLTIREMVCKVDMLLL